MKVRVRLFALIRDRAKVSETEIDLPDIATASDALAAISVRFPSVVDVLDRCAIAVNQEYVLKTTPLHDGDELAIIPPVSGGCI